MFSTYCVFLLLSIHVISSDSKTEKPTTDTQEITTDDPPGGEEKEDDAPIPDSKIKKEDGRFRTRSGNSCRHDCSGWPYQQCRHEGRYSSKGQYWSGSGTCIPPYSSRDKSYIYPSYPRCKELPSHWNCERCDEVCSKRDGKKGRNDYKIELPSDTSDEFHEKNGNGFCSYKCKRWPFQPCEMKSTEANGFRSWSGCIHPYVDNSRRRIYANYPSSTCGQSRPVRSGCKRCDDACAVKDGKRNRNDYRES